MLRTNAAVTTPYPTRLLPLASGSGLLILGFLCHSRARQQEQGR